MTTITPICLTLGDLRRYVEESGSGTLRTPGIAPEWAAPLGPATNDSRHVAPGGLFVALPGEQTDGHRFVGDASARGAAVLLVAHDPGMDLTEASGQGAGAAPGPVIWQVPDTLRALQGFAGWWRLRFPDLPVIGITGSVGKTTAKEVLAAALGTRMPVLASPRSFNNEIGVPLTLLSLHGEHRVAVLEMGIYDVGDIAFLAGIARQNIGVVLNVDYVHVERAGSIERIAQAKAEMVDTLGPDGVAVLNRDDPRVWAMASRAPGRVISFGLAAGADWQGLDLRVPTSNPMDQERRPHPFSMALRHAGADQPLASLLPGRHHAYALLAAAAAMDALGVPEEEIVPALETVPASAARQRLLQGREGRRIIDDRYNASPLSMAAALELLAGQAGRRVALLGDMLELGAVAEESHRRVGTQAAEAADLVIAVGPLARGIAEAAGTRAVWFPDKASLRPQLEELLAPGDTVLVKGSRGMALEEVVGWLCPGN